VTDGDIPIYPLSRASLQNVLMNFQSGAGVVINFHANPFQLHAICKVSLNKIEYVVVLERNKCYA